MGKEPSCVLNHDDMRRKLRDKELSPTECPNCGWMLSPAREEESDMEIKYLHCNECGNRVSTGFYPAIPEGIIIRAWIECPECIGIRKEGMIKIKESLQEIKNAIIK